jgi:translation initiation factor IF-2
LTKKKLKIDIKNEQIAKAIDLGSLKDKLAKRKAHETSPKEKEPGKKVSKEAKSHEEEIPSRELPKMRARSKSAFADKVEDREPKALPSPIVEEEEHPHTHEVEIIEEEGLSIEQEEEEVVASFEEPIQEVPEVTPVVNFEEKPPVEVKTAPSSPPPKPAQTEPKTQQDPWVKLGPTGRHIKDLLPPKREVKPQPQQKTPPPRQGAASPRQPASTAKPAASTPAERAKSKGKETKDFFGTSDLLEEDAKKAKAAKFKEFRDLKPRRNEPQRFDARDRQGLRSGEDEYTHRKQRGAKVKPLMEEVTVRPTQLSVRVPISIKDLASAMKLKASELIAKLFLQGIVVTINSMLDDETTIQLLGHELGCEIAIDTSEEERIRITDQSIKDEIQRSPREDLVSRAPVVAFMGHVDHGKTSLIDAIRKSNRAAGEAGAITQHIGAFRCHTPVGDITVLDTPGHEAFSAMRERGAEATDIVTLVVAGDEGMRQQTLEAMEHAKTAKVTIIVAINKSDKPNFNPENVYRQLAEHELLPEKWGGQTITVNCSAVTGEGIQPLLEMLALQAEVLELKANPKSRARGTVLESEMHKGLGAVATILVQNGTLRLGDAIVCDQFWGRIKTMHDEYNQDLVEAGPSTPVSITGLSGLPEAGQEFVVVKNEREAREIADVRMIGKKQKSQQQVKLLTIENMFEGASEPIQKKIFNIILRADVQGSLEALKTSLNKIESKKVELNIIFAGIGEISESDVQLAATSKATILGFHTRAESHADSMIKNMGVQVRLHDIIYHAVDDIKACMAAILDKLPIETDKGKAEVKAIFKSSHSGVIAGCMVIEGTINRNNHIRVNRGGQIIWKGPISSLKRVKEDVREVQKGFECGIVLSGFTGVQEKDILEAYEVTYVAQEL